MDMEKLHSLPTGWRPQGRPTFRLCHPKRVSQLRTGRSPSPEHRRNGHRCAGKGPSASLVVRRLRSGVARPVCFISTPPCAYRIAQPYHSDQEPTQAAGLCELNPSSPGAGCRRGSCLSRPTARRRLRPGQHPTGPWCSLSSVLKAPLRTVAIALPSPRRHWLVQIDSTIACARQHAAGTGRKGSTIGRANRTITAVGRSRGDLTTKIHLACDGKRRPQAVLLTEPFPTFL